MLLMGGNRLHYTQESYPFYLTEIEDTLILEKQINYCKTLNANQYLFCIKKEDIDSFHVDAVITQLIPEASIIPILKQTKGAVCTALLACGELELERELIIMSIDDCIDVESSTILHYFRNMQADAGVISFTSVHPRYSFARTLPNSNIVIEVAEKHPISKHALASFYYFKQANDFIECAKEVIRKDNPIHTAFYISQTLNEMILQQKKVHMYKIQNDFFHPLKTKHQLAQYLTELKELKESK